jgi:hypothetical protein
VGIVAKVVGVAVSEVTLEVTMTGILVVDDDELEDSEELVVVEEDDESVKVIVLYPVSVCPLTMLCTSITSAIAVRLDESEVEVAVDWAIVTAVAGALVVGKTVTSVQTVEPPSSMQYTVV